MRYTQPQSGPIQLDPGNPIARGIDVAFVRLDQPGIVGLAQLTKAGSPTLITTKYGQGWFFGNTTNDGFNTSNWPALADGTEYTYLVVTQLTATLGTDFLVNGDNSIRSFQFRIDSGAPSFIGFNTAVSTFQATGSAIPFGQVQAIAARYSSTAVSVFQNGTKTGTIAATGTIKGQSASDISIANRLALNLHGSIGLLIRWPHALSDAEASSVTNNPWQLFGSPKRPFWAVLAGGAVAYFKSLTASSSATARRNLMTKIKRNSGASSAVSFKRRISRKAAIASSTITTLIKIKAKLQSLTITSPILARLARTTKATKRATSASASTITPKKSLRRTIAVVASTIARISKRIGRKVAVVSTSTSTISRLKAKMVGLSAITASVAKKAIQIRARKSVTSATFGTFSIKRNLKRTINALGTSIARRVSKLAMTKKATTVSSSTLGRLKAKLVTLVATTASSAKKAMRIGAKRKATSASAAILSFGNQLRFKSLLAGSASVAKRITRIMATRKATSASAASLSRIKAKLVIMAASSATIARTAKALRKVIKFTQASSMVISKRANVRRVASQLSALLLSRTLPLKKTMIAISGSTGRMSRRVKKVLRAVSVSWLWALFAKTVNTNPDRINQNETITLKAHNRTITTDRKVKSITTISKIKSFIYRGKKMYTFSPKRPASAPVLSFNVAPDLAVGEVVTGVTVAVSLKSGVVDPSMAAMAVGVPTFSGSTVSQKISGGLSGNYYYITYLVTTTYQTIEIQAVLFVSTGAQ